MPLSLCAHLAKQQELTVPDIDHGAHRAGSVLCQKIPCRARQTPSIHGLLQPQPDLPGIQVSQENGILEQSCWSLPHYRISKAGHCWRSLDTSFCGPGTQERSSLRLGALGQEVNSRYISEVYPQTPVFWSQTTTKYVKQQNDPR